MSWPARLAIGVMRALAPMPLPVLRGAGALLSPLLFALAGSRRRITETNLALCFPEKSPAERRRIARRTFTCFAQTFFDRAWLWHAPRELIERRVTVRAAPELLRELVEGRDPLILFAPHFYGLDAGATGLTMQVLRPTLTIYTTQSNATIDEWVRVGRTRFGQVCAFDRMAGPKPVIKRLRQGEVLYLLPDMDFGPSHSVFAPFFGVQAATVPSLSRFASLGHAKVMPVRTRLTRTGYEIELFPIWEDFPSGDDESDAALMNRRLEAWIREMPEQYYWVHRRFKTRPPGQPSVYAR
ncbi:MAG: lysophospholipid acyltransferase family protein [Burkholderiaceae bacterium]|jgi:KDO2-lipid IV(A) lauroyltransferase|nr:lysophospholipid acyltransferase family protein [Burkholderiaceae bacterium]